MTESETLQKIKSRRKKMTKSNNKQAVAVKTRVNAGGTGHPSLTLNHNETVVVKTRVNAGNILCTNEH
jgi:hypothetical protein